MKKTILLFALLCGALNASEPDNEKITFAGDASVLAGPLIGSYTNGDKNGYPTAKSDFSFTAIHAAHVKIEGHIIVTTQEAADVVRALEILMPGIPDVYEKSEGNAGYGASMITPSYMAPMTATREQIDKGLKDLAWARSILELWKKKLEAPSK